MSDSLDSRGTQLFEVVPGREYNRLIVRYPYQDDSDQAYAYHSSAMRLASTYTAAPQDDAILLPFLMLFRQTFELKLKELIRMLSKWRRKCDATYSETSPGLDMRLRRHLRHDLSRLLSETDEHWQALKLGDVFPPTVKETILLVHAADGRGPSFRYSGGLPNVQESIDFPSLVELLDPEYGKLESAYDWIEEACYNGQY